LTAGDFCKYGGALVLCLVAVYYFLVPGVLVVGDLSDPAFRGEGIPRVAWRLHRNLSEPYARWARRRVASGKAAHLDLYDVPSTEWPMFGSVYYLWATEALQKAWEADPSLSREAPAVYARETISAAVDLVLDPVHHTWVKEHWGEDYMHTQNLFFRSLIIATLVCHENLVGDGKYLDRLREQADALADDLDGSAYGVLEDYPGECYPLDILIAIALIKRADTMLGIDRQAFYARATRAFEGGTLDERGLMPYSLDYHTGKPHDVSRGIVNSYVLIFAPELWPDKAAAWYDLYEKYFWQEKWWAAGFREFPNDLSGHDWGFDIDAGPIVAGFSPAANAFGLAAAKANGRLDHAWTIATQVVPACWPLPGGGLLGPCILSDPEHAPYLGQACMLFFLTQQPQVENVVRTGGKMTFLTMVGLAFFFAIGGFLPVSAVRALRKWRRERLTVDIPAERVQVGLWIALVAAGAVCLCAGHAAYGMVPIMLSLFLPRLRL